MMKRFSLLIIFVSLMTSAETGDQEIIKNLEFYQNMELFEQVRDVEFLLEEEAKAQEDSEDEFDD